MRVMRKVTRLVWTCAACCTLGFTQLAFAQPAPAREQPGGPPPESRQQPRGMQVGNQAILLAPEGTALLLTPARD